MWSPDSRWVAYSKSLDNHLRAVFRPLARRAQGDQITDGLADAISPAFDASGKYLYFLASTNYGPKDRMARDERDRSPDRRSVYLAVLERDGTFAAVARGRR